MCFAYLWYDILNTQEASNQLDGLQKSAKTFEDLATSSNGAEAEQVFNAIG